MPLVLLINVLFANLKNLLSKYIFLQARAKVELREVATELDALEVVEIMKQTITDIPDEKSPFFGANTSSSNGKPTKNKVEI